MKKLIILCLALCVGGQLLARETININRNWRFFSNTEGNSDGAIIVNLPHTWSNDALSGKKDYFRGVGNYMKDLFAPSEWQNKRIFIRFGAAGTVANLMINGKQVGEHRGSHTAFAFDITPYLRFGEQNVIWLMVNNASQFDVLPTAGDMNVYGGLFRDVELIVTEPSSIAIVENGAGGVYLNQRSVSPQLAEVDALIKINGVRGRNLLVSLAVITPTKDTISFQASKFKVPESGKGSITIPISLENPSLWQGTRNPYLYTVAVKVIDNTITCDSIDLPLGLRSFSVDPKTGFSLNGEPYPIQGVVYYEDRASVGPAIRTYHIDEDLNYMVEMGVNAIRAGAYPHNEYFYQECDKRGIIVWSDLPLVGPAYLTDRGFINTAAFRENGKKQLLEMIQQNYNHPSICMWGLFSDLDLRGDNPTEYINQLQQIALQEDPTRLTIASSNQDGPLNFVSDLIVWNHTLGWKEGLPSDINLWMDQLKSNWGNLRSGISYGAGASIYHQDDSLYRPTYYGNWHPERWQTFLHQEYYSYVKQAPYLWGTFVANMFDYGAAARTWGEGRGVDDRGMVTFDRKYTKDAFYFYKANWNKNEPFVYIAQKRWATRPSTLQSIQVFSNEKEVELFVNGVSVGRREGINGTCTCDGLTMKEGDNTVEARSQASIDHANITINSSNRKYGIN